VKKKQQQPYRVRNWREYNAALVHRGSLTFWLDEGALPGWLHDEPSGRRGASLTYSDAAITAALVLKAVYHLPLRGAQGLVGSLLQLMGVDLPVPHYTTLSRRQASLQVEVPRLGKGESLHLVVDSTGCKV
jgi:DDE family transposase